MNDIAVLTKADSVALDDMDVSDPKLYQDDIWYPYFARLRREAPVHYCRQSLYGPYWSVTKYKDIMQVDTSQKIYSSDALMGGIALRDTPMDYRRPSFISMDQPKHDEQRKVVSPVVAPMNLQRLSGTIRERTHRVLDELPRGEPFDWVDRVSIELTTQMLATLFDFPFEERRKLTYWSNVATVNTRAGTEIDSDEKRDAVLRQMMEYFVELWHERAAQPPGPPLDASPPFRSASRPAPAPQFGSLPCPGRRRRLAQFECGHSPQSRGLVRFAMWPAHAAVVRSMWWPMRLRQL